MPLGSLSSLRNTYRFVARTSWSALLLVSAFCPAYAQPAGAESVRFESSWARFRTAAADLLGWRVAVPAPTLDAAVKADALGVAYVELPASPDPAIKTKLRALNLRAPAMRAPTADRALFERAKDLG